MCNLTLKYCIPAYCINNQNYFYSTATEMNIVLVFPPMFGYQGNHPVAKATGQRKCMKLEQLLVILASSLYNIYKIKMPRKNI